MASGWARDDKFFARHFIIMLKEKTFECLASSLAVEKFCAARLTRLTHM